MISSQEYAYGIGDEIVHNGEVLKYRGYYNGHIYTTTVDQGDVDPVWEDQFVDVFENGELLVEYSFSDVRKLANSQ